MHNKQKEKNEWYRNGKVMGETLRRTSWTSFKKNKGHRKSRAGSSRVNRWTSREYAMNRKRKKGLPLLHLNFSHKVAHELQYGMLNNVVSLNVPIKNTDKKVKVNFKFPDVLNPTGWDITEMYIDDLT